MRCSYRESISSGPRLQDLEWGAQDAAGQPVGLGCDVCMKTVVALLPDREFVDVAEAVKKGATKGASDADVMLRDMVLAAIERYREQQDEGNRPLFSPASTVSNMTGYGYRVYWEVLLCSASDLTTLSGRPAKSLGAAPIKIKLDGENAQTFWPLSMQGLSEDQVRGIKRMQVYYDTQVEHGECFLSPEHQLHQDHGTKNFGFYTKKHFAARPGVGRVGGKPYILKKLIQEAEMQEAKNAATVAAVSAASSRKQPEKGSDSSEEESSGSGGEDKEPETAKPKARAAPTPSLGSLRGPDAKKVARKPKAAAARRNSPFAKKPPSSSAAKPRSLTVGGSKKDRELAAQLDDLEQHDPEMFKVAKDHLRNATGSSAACLKQLNVNHFLTNTKQGQVLNAASCLI